MIGLLGSFGVANAFSNESNDMFASALYSTEMDSHGSFIAADLLTSPLLRSMFNLSANSINHDYVRICLIAKNQCRVVRADAKIFVVSSNGKVSFDDSVTK